MDGVEPLDVSDSLLKGTLFAAVIIALLLILFLRRDVVSQLGNLLSSGFGWFG